MRKLILWMSESDRLRKVATQWSPAQKFARRFAAGETMEQALAVTETLNDQGFKVTLDHLGEEVSGAAGALRAVEDYSTCIDVLARESLDATISVKLTQLGLNVDTDLVETNLRRLARKARERDSFVRIDMEGSAYTEATLRIFRSVFRDHANVGIAIQSYLRRSEEDIADLIRLGAPVRLVKGAYDEPKELAFEEKQRVDENFVRLMQLLIDAGVPTAIATHDEAMIDSTLSYMSDNSGSNHDVEFQMLYGVNRELQRKLLRDGHPVRVYVPFGSDWFHYMMRRIAERPANAWFVVRAMVG